MIGLGSDKKCKGENARADCLSKKPEDPFDSVFVFFTVFVCVFVLVLDLSLNLIKSEKVRMQERIVYRGSRKIHLTGAFYCTY